jgi:hypothetical protein
MLATATVMIIDTIIKLLSLKFKKINNKIRKAFCGPAIIRQVFQLEKLKT